MKISEGITQYVITGECQINVDRIVRCFGKSFVSRWENEWRLHNRKAGVKITISADDAQELIRRLDLEEHPSGIFAHGSTYHRKRVTHVGTKSHKKS